MKNIAVNTLAYTGIVTLSQYKGNKKTQVAKIHNTGGSPLFRFLANCIAGDFTNSQAGCPARIRLINRDISDQGYEYTSVSGFIFKQSSKIIVDNLGECRVRYSFMIPRDLLENVTSVETLGLGLYNMQDSDPANFVAFCALGTAGLELTRTELSHASLLVDWDLIISNSTQRSTNNG